jgi:hypothetical protein
MLWTMYSAAGPFQGHPVPETSQEFSRLLLEKIGWFRDQGPEGIQVALDLQKAGADYASFKSQAQGIADRFARDSFERKR